MSAAESEAALDRLVAWVDQWESDLARWQHMLVAMSILGYNAPEVLGFILDRADEQFGAQPTPPTAGPSRG